MKRYKCYYSVALAGKPQTRETLAPLTDAGLPTSVGKPPTRETFPLPTDAMLPTSPGKRQWRRQTATGNWQTTMAIGRQRAQWADGDHNSQAGRRYNDRPTQVAASGVQKKVEGGKEVEVEFGKKVEVAIGKKRGMEFGKEVDMKVPEKVES